MRGVYDLLRLLDELINAVRFPLKLVEGWEQSYVHLLDSVFDQRLFYGVQTGDDLVIVLNDEIQADDLHSEHRVFLEDLLGMRRDLVVQLFKVVDLSEKSYERCVEVYLQEPVLVFDKERELQFFEA